MFKKATRQAAKLRMALIGPSGSGKTYSALRIAVGLGGRIALIDTEHGTSRKYADTFDYDVEELDSFHPDRYVEAMYRAVQDGYDVLIIDSLSHAWAGRNGALELVDQAAKSAKGRHDFSAWREVTPLHNALIDGIARADIHVIATMRAKTRYVLEQDDRGKTQVKRLGMEPVQRDGVEYEFDITADMDLDNTLIVSKSRCPALHKGVFHNPGADVACILNEWLSDRPLSQAAETVPGPGTPSQRPDESRPDPCLLAQLTKDLFDEHSVNEEGRKIAFRAIRHRFKISRLDEIPRDAFDRYWKFVRHVVLPPLTVGDKSDDNSPELNQ